MKYIEIAQKGENFPIKIISTSVLLHRLILIYRIYLTTQQNSTERRFVKKSCNLLSSAKNIDISMPDFDIYRTALLCSNSGSAMQRKNSSPDIFIVLRKKETES